MIDNLQLKKELYQKCSEHITERINVLQAALDSVYHSKLQETKSSSGDKFETGRTMMQMEEEKLKTQLHHAKIDSEVLIEIDRRSAVDVVGPGNLVLTSQGIYFIAVGIGKVRIDGAYYYCVSTKSPIGAELIGKIVSDKIEFNGRVFEVDGIF
jgi:hypothetical protein